MSAFYFAFLAVLFAGLGARDQRAVANLSLRQGARPAALLVGLVTSFATAAFAAWAASSIASLLAPKAGTGPDGAGSGRREPGIALAFRLAQPEEPTASLGALGIVLLAHQLTDAARFLVFALAVALAAPFAAGVGGAAGGAVAITAGWMLPEVFADARLRWARRTVGAVLLLAALIVGYRAFTA